MSTFLNILMIVVWGALALIIGSLLFTVIVLIIPTMIKEYHARLFPDKASSKAWWLEHDFDRYGPNHIIFPSGVKPENTELRSEFDMGNLQSKLNKLRSELWAKDMVLPDISFIYTAEQGKMEKDFKIRFAGKEIFSGELDSALSDEEKADFIIEKIKTCFMEK
ncbi:MAG: hypothetical protein J5597_02135 [Spirochaetaceae bacterium]|nr:hypothetical protein [Spirochaetaceae bacterium]